MEKQMILKNDEQAVLSLRSLYRQYGYQPFKMSRFEEYDLYVRNKDFLVSDQVITFSDRSGRLLALKPDVTLSIIKNAQDAPGLVQKVYYNENVYRVDKGTNAFKEIMQAGLECVGDLGEFEIAEVVLLAAKSLSVMGERFVLDLSHMGLIGTVLEESGLSEPGKKDAIGYLRQKNSHDLLALCRRENCSDSAVRKLQALLQNSGAPDAVLPAMRAIMTGDGELAALAELERLCGVLEDRGFGGSVNLDFSVGSDMKYYSGVVFKGYLEGLSTSVLSGGQYDKLLRRMGRTSSAIGFAVYLDLLEQRSGENYDVEYVLLHKPSDDVSQVAAAAETLREKGSVLVTTQLPAGRSWRQLAVFRDGEAVIDGYNG